MISITPNIIELASAIFSGMPIKDKENTIAPSLTPHPEKDIGIIERNNTNGIKIILFKNDISLPRKCIAQKKKIIFRIFIRTEYDNIHRLIPFLKNASHA